MLLKTEEPSIQFLRRQRVDAALTFAPETLAKSRTSVVVCWFHRNPLRDK